jgi:hypothetical protein
MEMSHKSQIPIGENHRSTIATTLGLLDEMLSRFERWAKGAEARSVLYLEQNTLREQQKREILTHIKAIRELLSQLRDDLGLPPKAQDVAGAIWSESACSWEAVVELGSRYLRAYGEVPPQLAVYIDPKVELLIERLMAISEAARGSGEPR